MRRGFWLVGMIFVVCCAFAYAAVSALGASSDRVFEMVSPVFKGGYGATRVEAVAGDGGAMMFFSPGAFSGAPSGPQLTADYVAHRGALEWSISPVMVPAALTPYVGSFDISPSLDTVLSMGKPGLNQEQAFQLGDKEEFLLHSTDLPDTVETWGIAGAPLEALPPARLFALSYEGASTDFCHLFFLENASEPLLPEAPSTLYKQIYELDRGCGGGPVALRLLSVKNKVGVHGEPEIINSECGVDVGISNYGSGLGDQFNAIADDGNQVFFTTCIGPLTGSHPHQLFMRLGGVKTVEISKPLSLGCEEVPCVEAEKRASADFAGAAEDGSKVFFTATLAAVQSPLVPGDTDASKNLYMADIACPQTRPGCPVAERQVVSLTQVSHDTHGGETAEVQRVMLTSPDGSRVYFVARGRLSAGPNSEGSLPLVGANNLYTYDSESGTVTFIGDLCTGPETSGIAEDTHCPSVGGREDNLLESQTAGTDGRFLTFTTYARLTRDDTDAAKDVYRYDAQTAALSRVSRGESGFSANGNGEANGSGEPFNATIPINGITGQVREQHELKTRAISEDGSRIVFESSEPLSPAATNGLANVYEWHEGPEGGSVSLISGGSALEPVGNAVISAQGSDIAFVTVQGLVPQDTDGTSDVYDARIGGGFPLSPATVSPCSGDGCQGPLTNPAPLLVPGSVTQAAGENLPAPMAQIKTKKKPKKPVKAKRRKSKRKRKGSVKRAVHGSVGIKLARGR